MKIENCKSLVNKHVKKIIINQIIHGAFGLFGLVNTKCKVVMHRKAGRLQGPDEGSRAQLFHNHHKSKNTIQTASL